MGVPRWKTPRTARKLAGAGAYTSLSIPVFDIEDVDKVVLGDEEEATKLQDDSESSYLSKQYNSESGSPTLERLSLKMVLKKW